MNMACRLDSRHRQASPRPADRRLLRLRFAYRRPLRLRLPAVGRWPRASAVTARRRTAEAGSRKIGRRNRMSAEQKETIDWNSKL